MSMLQVGAVYHQKYRIEGTLGEGGMGTVYLATQLDLNRRVAFKVLQRATNPEHRARFLREVKLVASLNHPNVVRLLDFFEWSDFGPMAMVMELVDGRSLSAAVSQDGAFDEARVTELGLQLADAVAAAHDMGIIHRDIKPSNVMLTKTPAGREGVRLVDFGVARETAGQDFTREGDVIGTMHWLAPEQVEGARADVLSDVYAIGATLFFAAAGRRPYPQTTVANVARAICNGDRERLGTLRPYYRVAAVIEQAMSHKRAHRHSSARALASALSNASSGIPAGGQVATPVDDSSTRVGLDLPIRERTSGFSKGVSALAIGGAVVVLAAGTVVIHQFRSRSSSEPAPATATGGAITPTHADSAASPTAGTSAVAVSSASASTTAAPVRSNTAPRPVSNPYSGRACQTPHVMCNGACVSTTNNLLNCGQCGYACPHAPPGRSSSCMNGRCVTF